MLFEPSFIVLHIDDMKTSSAFYQDLLGIMPEEDSPSFHRFTLSNGISLSLKEREDGESDTAKKSHVELAFTVANNQKVDELFAQWQAKKIKTVLSPSIVPFGYTFIAKDPDGNHLRVVSLGESK